MEIIIFYLVPKVLKKDFNTMIVMYEYRIEIGKQSAPDLPTDIVEAATINVSTKDDFVVCRSFHKSTGLKKMVMSSYAPPSLMSIGAAQHRGFLKSSTLAPLMYYDVLLSLAPPPLLLATSVYHMLTIGARSSMMASVALPTSVYIFLH
ncbi:uncharacterized protein LOC119293102 [Triticum dicoccoides]|uniref:uncharacterized protein LOC119293102 n=1 Tax=Triticum dicoccoides TaxID=85692 RepID=UPI00188E2E61|nr:uncharacterized protein LOC119293102 [Triticum dicoccoides]